MQQRECLFEQDELRTKTYRCQRVYLLEQNNLCRRAGFSFEQTLSLSRVIYYFRWGGAAKPWAVLVVKDHTKLESGHPPGRPRRLYELLGHSREALLIRHTLSPGEACMPGPPEIAEPPSAAQRFCARATNRATKMISARTEHMRQRGFLLRQKTISAAKGFLARTRHGLTLGSELFIICVGGAF